MDKPKKYILVNQEHIDDMEEWFSDMDKSDPMSLAEAFGTWLNLYFTCWNPKRATWIDTNHQAFTTEELLNEFVETH
jgi:hypothetical protein